MHGYLPNALIYSSKFHELEMHKQLKAIYIYMNRNRKDTSFVVIIFKHTNIAYYNYVVDKTA